VGVLLPPFGLSSGSKTIGGIRIKSFTSIQDMSFTFVQDKSFDFAQDKIRTLPGVKSNPDPPGLGFFC